MEQLQCITTLRGGGGQWNFYNTLCHCAKAIGSGTLAAHCQTVLGQWAAGALLHNAKLPRCSWQWDSYPTVPYYTGALVSGTLATHCRNALWQCIMKDLLHCNSA